MMTTIQVTTNTRDRLRRLVSKGQPYDMILRRLLDDAETRMLYEREKRILETEEFVPLDQA